MPLKTRTIYRDTRTGRIISPQSVPLREDDSYFVEIVPVKRSKVLNSRLYRTGAETEIIEGRPYRLRGDGQVEPLPSSYAMGEPAAAPLFE